METDNLPSSSQEKEFTKLISQKEHQIKQLHQKEEKLSEIELICQKEKEYLLEQYKHVFHDKPWSKAQYSSDYKKHSISANKWHDEACKLLSEIQQQKEQNKKLECQVREAKANKQLRDTYNLVLKQKQADEIKVNESLLSKWSKIITNQLQSEEIDALKTESGNKQLPLTDKLFYHVKYQDLTSDNCPVSTGKSKTRSVPGNFLEMLSFSTRRNGICVAVTITREGKKTTRKSDSQPSESAVYEVFTDPHIENSERALDFLHNGGPDDFVRQVIWNFIDTEIS